MGQKVRMLALVSQALNPILPTSTGIRNCRRQACPARWRDREKSMYQAYWGLGESPFRGHLDARYFHQSATQEEALARLHFLVEERRTLGLLLGEAGSGKSQLFEIFAAQLPRFRRQVA